MNAAHSREQIVSYFSWHGKIVRELIDPELLFQLLKGSKGLIAAVISV